jgi:hypothetical protein
MVRKNEKTIMREILKNSRTVFRINDIALLLDNEKTNILAKKLYYYVKTGDLLNPRKGFYAKEGYKSEELACLLYPPTYISLEYVLQRAGVVFQYDSAITNVSYLTREIEIDNTIFRYRTIKGEILTNPSGIMLNHNNINIATPERAFLDMIYLNRNYYFDNLRALDKKVVHQLLPIYNSLTLTKLVTKLLSQC